MPERSLHQLAAPVGSLCVDHPIRLAVEEPLAVVKDNLRAAPREAQEAGKRVAAVLRGQTENRSADVGDGQKHKEEETTV